MSAFFQLERNDATIMLMVTLAVSDFDPADSLKPVPRERQALPYRFALR